jgi:hypothetical protein
VYRATVHFVMNNDIRLEDQSLHLLVDTGRTGEESVANGVAVYLEERSQVESSDSPSFRSASFLSIMAMPASERRAWVLILPRIFFIAW